MCVIHQCKYCNKIVKSLNGLKHHEPYCKLNPNRKQHHDVSPEANAKKSHVGWNKGKTKYTDDRIRMYGEKTSHLYKTGQLIHKRKKHTEETKKKLSNIRKQFLKDNPGSIHKYSVKKHIYKNTIFDSGWEILFAQYLDDNNISWERPGVGFEYEFEQDIHLYFPDFFLPELNIFVEIKGYKQARDEAKWNSLINDHGCKLIIITLKEINKIKKNEFDLYQLI